VLHFIFGDFVNGEREKLTSGFGTVRIDTLLDETLDLFEEILPHSEREVLVELVGAFRTCSVWEVF